MKFTISSGNNNIVKNNFRTERIGDCKWKIYDNNHSYLEWEATFLSVDEWKIESKDMFPQFVVYMYSCGNKVDVHKAIENGRTLKADKFLKKYDQIACMMNGLIQNNMFKN